MAKFVFQVSKFHAGKNRLFLKQRYNRATDAVTAMATLYLDSNTYVSGMHYAYQDDEGDISYSFDKGEAAAKIKVDVTVNFKEEQVENVKQQIAAAGTTLTKPPVDDDGVSELRGWQLHVVIKPGEEITYIKDRDPKWGDKLVYKVQPYQVKEVKLVTASDEAYIEAPGAAKIDLDLAMKSLYASREKVQVQAKPTTVEEAQTVLLDFSKATSRGERRKAAKAAKAATVQTENGAIAVETALSEIPPSVPAKVQPVNQQIVLVDDEEDEDKPE